ncbi:hypothetical protein GHHBBDOD_00205 [Aeromonas phage avDM4]|nr:hypothetical protein GHHBBDOD_00205 [Aeromonas phage avDM4]
MKSELYKRGYKWAFDAAKTQSLEEIEEKADDAFDFNEFDRGALDAVRDIQNTENKT